MQSKMLVRGALCAVSFFAAVAIGTTALGGEPGAGSSGSAPTPRYIVKTDGTVYDFLPHGPFSIVTGGSLTPHPIVVSESMLLDLASMGLIEDLGVDVDGRVVVVLAVAPGGGLGITSVEQQRMLLASDCEDDDGADGPASFTGDWDQLVRGTDIDNDDDADIVVTGKTAMNPGPG